MLISTTTYKRGCNQCTTVNPPLFNSLLFRINKFVAATSSDPVWVVVFVLTIISRYNGHHKCELRHVACTMYIQPTTYSSSWQCMLYMATIYGALPQFNWDEQVSDCTNQVHTATHLDLPQCTFPKLGLPMLG